MHKKKKDSIRHGCHIFTIHASGKEIFMGFPQRETCMSYINKELYENAGLDPSNPPATSGSMAF